MDWPTVTLALVAAGVILWLLDRLLLIAEGRGWIYWRRIKPHASSLGSAMLTVQALLEPEKQHVVEERERQAAEIDIAGDDLRY